MSLIGLIGAALAGASFLFIMQRRMIYFPRRYEPRYALGLPSNTFELEYETSAGHQTAFYAAPLDAPGKPPRRLWMLWGGNAALALDWLDLIEKARDGQSGFLLIDYPGYGKCQGKPSMKRIEESSEGALRALATRLHVDPARLESDLNVIGHSLGAAAALQFAAGHPVRQAILISPFTSLADVARGIVGWPLCQLALDRFDNRARLSELAARGRPPGVLVLHGDADQVIPVRMGRELARMFPRMISYREIHGADHNFILDAIADQIAAAMKPEPISP